MNCDDYWALPKDKRWLEGDNPYSIGGWDTEATMAVYSLSTRIREIYPINEVPLSVVALITKALEQAVKTEASIEKIINAVSKDKANG